MNLKDLNKTELQNEPYFKQNEVGALVESGVITGDYWIIPAGGILTGAAFALCPDTEESFLIWIK